MRVADCDQLRSLSLAGSCWEVPKGLRKELEHFNGLPQLEKLVGEGARRLKLGSPGLSDSRKIKPQSGDFKRQRVRHSGSFYLTTFHTKQRTEGVGMIDDGKLQNQIRHRDPNLSPSRVLFYFFCGVHNVRHSSRAHSREGVEHHCSVLNRSSVLSSAISSFENPRGSRIAPVTICERC